MIASQFLATSALIAVILGFHADIDADGDSMCVKYFGQHIPPTADSIFKSALLVSVALDEYVNSPLLSVAESRLLLNVNADVSRAVRDYLKTDIRTETDRGRAEHELDVVLESCSTSLVMFFLWEKYVDRTPDAFDLAAAYAGLPETVSDADKTNRILEWAKSRGVVWA